MEEHSKRLWAMAPSVEGDAHALGRKNYNEMSYIRLHQPAETEDIDDTRIERFKKIASSDGLK
eukprot:scaffold20276_cov224-Skeletonema_marinoi.AAC.15